MSLLALAAEGAPGAEPTFPPFNSEYFATQIFWLAVFFAVLYLVLSRTILPRLSANIERRSDTIANDLDEAARLNEQAEEAQRALEVKLAQAHARARATADAARAEMDEEIAQETQRVDAQVAEKLDEAEAKIAKLRDEAMSNVSAIAIGAADAIVARLGGGADASKVEAAVTAALARQTGSAA